MNQTTFSHPLTSYFEGAAVAFGLMGMAEAIRARHVCSHWLTGPYGDVCKECGKRG